MTLAYNVVPFTETKAEISKSGGACIYRHLLLKDLVFDPITQIILENEPYRWKSDATSNVSQQGQFVHSVVALQDPLDDHLLIDSLGLNDNMAALQAELAAFDAEVDAFVQA